MRNHIYYDSEFTGLHRNATLISIGLISDSGAFFYAEFNDYDKTQVDDWIQEHVVNNLMFNHRDFYISPLDEHLTFTDEEGYGHFSIIEKADRAEIKERLLNWLCNESKTNYNKDPLKLQFYIDCYAYDWMLLNDLICEDGQALNIPDYIDYIPIDLSTYMYCNGIDPDINREEYLGESLIDIIKKEYIFSLLPRSADNIRHNSLWDAMLTKYCFYKIALDTTPNFRHYKYSFPIPDTGDHNLELPKNILDQIGEMGKKAETEHPVFKEENN